VDLYDPVDASGSDAVDLLFTDIRMVWSLFEAGTADGDVDECKGTSTDPDGVNAYDYAFHYAEIREAMGWPRHLSSDGAQLREQAHSGPQLFAVSTRQQQRLLLTAGSERSARSSLCARRLNYGAANDISAGRRVMTNG
jgi:hypothetical protein